MQNPADRGHESQARRVAILGYTAITLGGEGRNRAAPAPALTAVHSIYE
jgi:hypothetical protein